MLTVPVEGGLDAIFFYDDLTRDLTGFVINVNGVFNVKYKVNIERFFTGPGGNVSLLLALPGFAYLAAVRNVYVARVYESAQPTEPESRR